MPSLSCSRYLYLAALFVTLSGVVFAQEASTEKVEKTTFAAGEKVEVWWAGKYVPGEIVALEENGWVRVKFSLNGREQTIKQPGDGQWVRRPVAAAAPAARPAAPRPGRPLPAAEHANPFAAAEAPAPRTWTDSTGKFKIEATFAGKEGDNVLLTKTDGKTIKLPLDKLSKEDQDHVAGLMAKPAEANPFAKAEEVGDAAYDRPADWSTVEQILPQPAGGWPLVPDAAAAPQQALPASAIGLGGGGQDRFFENPTSLLFNSSKNEAVVVFVHAPPGKDREVRIAFCDLNTGKLAGETRLTTSVTPIDLSPSGQLLACLPDQFGRNASEKNKIAILRHEAGGLTPTIRWNMGEGVEFAKKFEHLHFIGEDKLLTFSVFGGSATLWQIDQARALWSLKTGSQCIPALSANRNQFAAPVDGGIGIFSTATGDTLARISTTAPKSGCLSFSPDGKQLAHLTSAVLLVYDLTTGKQSHEVWFPRPLAGKSVDWCEGSFVLVDRTQLVDLDKRIVLWKYTVPGQPIAAAFGGRLWVVSGGHNNPNQLFSPTLPSAEAKAKGERLTADGVLALKPGAQLSVQVNLAAGVPGADAQKVTQTLTDALTAQGFTVANGAPITLEATVTDAGKESVSYRGFGRGRFGSDKVEVQKYNSVVTMKENGKEIWTAQMHYGAPHMVRQKDGQTIQDAVNEQRGNPTDFFTHVRIPRFMARHEADGAYGTSKLAP